ncbi:MAG: hypothetical protein ACYDAB_08115 [bacterium]
MRRHLLLPTLLWAVTATALLVTSLAWPDTLRSAATALTEYVRPRAAEAQPAVAPARLEWLGWHHASFMPPDRRGRAFVDAVNARPALRGRVRAYDPRPGQEFLRTPSGVRVR